MVSTQLRRILLFLRKISLGYTCRFSNTWVYIVHHWSHTYLRKPEVFTVPKLKRLHFLFIRGLKWENMSVSEIFLLHMNSKRKIISIRKGHIMENKEWERRGDKFWRQFWVPSHYLFWRSTAYLLKMVHSKCNLKV